MAVSHDLCSIVDWRLRIKGAGIQLRMADETMCLY